MDFTANTYRAILDHVTDGVYIVATTRKIVYWNRAAEEITGFSAGEMLGLHCSESKLSHIDLSGSHRCTAGCPLFWTMESAKEHHEKVFVRHKCGYRLPIMTHVLPIVEEGKVVAAVEIFTRTSPKVYDDSLIESLSGAAMLDELTRLPNRRSMEGYLAYQMVECEKYGRTLAVLFADIDGIHHFNNTYGHAAGDLILKNIATTVRSNLKAGDRFARWGGEEFVVLLPGLDLDAAAVFGNHLRRVVASFLRYNQQPITASVGAAIFHAGSDTAQAMFKRADQALYAAKAAGRDCLRVEAPPHAAVGGEAERCTE